MPLTAFRKTRMCCCRSVEFIRRLSRLGGRSRLVGSPRAARGAALLPHSSQRGSGVVVLARRVVASQVLPRTRRISLEEFAAAGSNKVVAFFIGSAQTCSPAACTPSRNIPSGRLDFAPSSSRSRRDKRASLWPFPHTNPPKSQSLPNRAPSFLPQRPRDQYFSAGRPFARPVSRVTLVR